MRPFIMYAGVITLMIAVSAVAAEPQQSRAFGHWGQVWGTWVWTINNQIPALVTLHIDGTVSIFHEDDTGRFRRRLGSRDQRLVVTRNATALLEELRA
jgi:hypothetical protein